MYKQHTFYTIKHLPLNRRIAIINDAYKVNTKFWVDKLDCTESCRRQCIDMSFEDIMKMFDKACHFVVIQRKGRLKDEHPYGEIGFSTMKGSPVYYLWIYTTLADLDNIVKKHNLKPNE